MLKILYITGSDLDAIKQKGVMRSLLSRSEDGLFDEIISFHPFAKKKQTVPLSENHQLIETSSKQGYFSLFCELFFFLPLKLRKKNITVIRAQDPFLSGLIGVYYSKIIRAPLVISVHSDYDLYATDGSHHYLLGSRYLTYWVEKICYFFADKILPIRSHLASQLIQKQIALKNKIQLFPHSVNLNLIHAIMSDHIALEQFKLKLGKGKRKYLLSFVGRLSEENHLMDLLEIILCLCEMRKDFILFIAGDGCKKAAMEKFIEQHGLKQHVFFLGWINFESVIRLRYLSSVSVNLVGGYSLLEAAAAGTPFIAYDIDWHCEIVFEGKNGFLIKPKAFHLAAEKINFLLDHPSVRETFSKKSRDIVRKNFSDVTVIPMKQAFYRALLQ